MIIIIYKILSYIAQSNEVSSSNHMEKKGLQLGALVSDKHLQIQKWMREEHTDIKNYLDVYACAYCMVCGNKVIRLIILFLW